MRGLRANSVWTARFLAGVLACTASCDSNPPAACRPPPDASDERFLACVISNADRENTQALLDAGVIALGRRSYVDGGFLVEASWVRSVCDRVFPPTETGSGTPEVLFSALRHVVREAVEPVLFARPDLYGDVASRLRRWRPVSPATYEPGWSHRARLDSPAIVADCERAREVRISAIETRIRRLKMPAVARCLRLLQYRVYVRYDIVSPDRGDLVQDYVDRVLSGEHWPFPGGFPSCDEVEAVPEGWEYEPEDPDRG